MDYKFSIIIRTYNEEKWIKEVMKSIYNQCYKNFEVIVVDSGSTDSTLEICNEFDCKIVNINKSDFNYSYASNIGAKHSNGDVLCYLSGHSVIKNDNYLEIANKLFGDIKVGGVYGDVIALPDGSLIEKIFHYLGSKKSKLEGRVYENSIHPGILSCSNAMIRKSIWENNEFKEELGHGGEDVLMAYFILNEGYKIVKDPDILVKHSHGNSLIKFINEFKGWRRMYNDVLKYIEKNN